MELVGKFYVLLEVLLCICLVASIQKAHEKYFHLILKCSCIDFKYGTAFTWLVIIKVKWKCKDPWSLQYLTYPKKITCKSKFSRIPSPQNLNQIVLLSIVKGLKWNGRHHRTMDLDHTITPLYHNDHLLLLHCVPRRVSAQDEILLWRWNVPA